MKKLLFGTAVFAAVFALSCASGPASTADSEQTVNSGDDFTHEDVTKAYDLAFEAYQGKIITEGAQKYTVARGDSLSKIAIKYYGDKNNYGYFFTLIMMASGHSNPEMIEPGQTLTIPDLQKNLNDPDARGAIKAFLLDIAEIYKRVNRPYSALSEANLTSLSNSL